MLSANITKEVRKSIYRRDGYRCALCDSTRFLQIYHVVPRGRGGTNSPHNLITLCSDCHALAHGTNLRDFVDVDQETIQHACVEYLADYYAGEGYLWSPWAADPEDPSLNLLDHRNHPKCRDELPYTDVERIAWEQLRKGGD